MSVTCRACGCKLDHQYMHNHNCSGIENYSTKRIDEIIKTWQIKENILKEKIKEVERMRELNAREHTAYFKDIDKRLQNLEIAQYKEKVAELLQSVKQMNDEVNRQVTNAKYWFDVAEFFENACCLNCGNKQKPTVPNKIKKGIHCNKCDEYEYRHLPKATRVDCLYQKIKCDHGASNCS